MTDHQATIEPRGEFELSRAITFLEEWPATQLPANGSDLRFSYCSESDWQPVDIRVSQSGRKVDLTMTAPVEDEVARILSLDIDGTPLTDIAGRDPVVARLLAAAPGLRPVCFWTPWEAACWAVLSQRTSRRTATAHKQRITSELGTRTAFPSPQVILEAQALPGVNPVKLERLHALAAAALDGTLTTKALRAVPADVALATLQELPGIGPFSADLILIRGAGSPDIAPTTEPRLLTAIQHAYELAEPPTPAEFRAITDAWQPLRSWVSFFFRAIPLPA